MRFIRRETVAVCLAGLSIVIGTVVWITFPSTYKHMLYKNLRFQQNQDLSLGYSAFMMAHPPIKNVMKFYFFNVTNPDEIIYQGEKPQLVETGAYAFLETEEKKYIEFTKSQHQLFYQNYKKYNYNLDDSSPGVSYEDIIVFPNPTAIGAVASMANPNINISKTGKFAITMTLLLLGEYPFTARKVREILFDGYNDALLDVAHSDFLYMLGIIFNGGKSLLPFPVPDMPKFGYFQGYNMSYDENYWIRTGVRNIEELGDIVSWAGRKSLPSSWWKSPYSLQIRGSDSASFCKPNLKSSDDIPFFFSFMCRSFTKKFTKKTEVKGIPTMEYSVPYEDYDTTSDLNAGFRYDNPQKVNYYPSWPKCPKNCCTTQLKADACKFCCGRNIVNGTSILPPGMFPLVCYPGHLREAPFSVIYSPPHFLYSPPEVVNAVAGMSPDPEKHRPFVYQHEPKTGSVLQADVRLQVNMPIMRYSHDVQSTHIPNSIVPLFWQDAHATLQPYTYRKLKFGVITVPIIINVLKLVLIGAGTLGIVACIFFRCRKIKPQPSDLEVVRF